MTNHHHIPSYISDVLTWALLITLTGLTVWASYLTAGTTVLAVTIAMAIATTKSVFVVRNFMHLKYDHVIYKVFVGVVIALFLSFMILLGIDYALR